MLLYKGSGLTFYRPVNRLVTDWLVVAKTVDEAYRIVKHFNMLPHIAPSGTRYMLTAEICW